MVKGEQSSRLRDRLLQKDMGSATRKIRRNVKRKSNLQKVTDHGVKIHNIDIKNNISVLYLNARSIRNKVNELMAQIILNDYDLVAITETWLKDGHDWELNIQGYQTIRKDRVDGKGGGVALLFKDGIRAIVRDDIGAMEDKVESIWVEIRNSKAKKSLIGVVYRPPNSNIMVRQAINKEITDACRNGTAVIMGDFNMHVDWFNEVGKGSLEEEFVECIRDNFLEQYVMEPTREKAVLDLVLCNETGLINDLIVRDPLGKSDHSMVEFKIGMEGEKVKSNTTVLCLNKGDYDGMREELAKVDWDQRLHGEAVEEQWRIFQAIFHCAQKRFIPTKKKDGRKRKNRPWISKEIRDSIKLKEKTYKVAKISGKLEDWEIFKGQQKATKKAIKKSRIDYESKLAQNIKTDSKSFYKYIKQKRVAKVNIGPLEDEKGDLIIGDEDMAEELNRFFGSVFTVEDTNNMPVTDGKKAMIGEDLEMIVITKEVVMGKLMGLKVDKSPGPDGMHPRVLKEMAREIANALAIIYQNSINSGVVPADWKLANVTPLFKKGGRQKAGNYRPVSLTSVVGKMLESIIKEEIARHLDGNCPIGQTQHGFIKGRSCLTNLVEFFEEVTSAVDNGEPMDVVYLDFQKAFDKVPHKRLLHKLKIHGIKGKVVAWVEDWLINRKQRVGINGCFSGWKPVTSGVPQGSVLGPQLFTIYIDDLELGTECNVSKFADDTKMSGKAKSAEDTGSLQRDLDRLSEWARVWQMEYNVAKCEVIHFGRSNSKRDYYLNDKILKHADVQRDLGVLVHETQKVGVIREAAVPRCERGDRRLEGILASPRGPRQRPTGVPAPASNAEEPSSLPVR